MAKNVRSGDLGSGKGTFIVKEGSKEGKGAYSTKRSVISSKYHMTG